MKPQANRLAFTAFLALGLLTATVEARSLRHQNHHDTNEEDDTNKAMAEEELNRLKEENPQLHSELMLQRLKETRRR